jgi:hypothetical protein
MAWRHEPATIVAVNPQARSAATGAPTSPRPVRSRKLNPVSFSPIGMNTVANETPIANSIPTNLRFIPTSGSAVERAGARHAG